MAPARACPSRCAEKSRSVTRPWSALTILSAWRGNEPPRRSRTTREQGRCGSYSAMYGPPGKAAGQRGFRSFGTEPYFISEPAREKILVLRTGGLGFVGEVGVISAG